MKRLLYFLIPTLLVILIVFGILKVFVLPEGGKGALQVTSQPESKVYLNDSYIGNTPLCKCEASTMMRSGTYTLKLIPSDTSLPEFQEKITITKGVLTVVDRTFGKGAASEGSIISLSPITNKSTSELLVISFPEKADIFVDTNDEGQSPLLLSDLTESDHTLRLRKDGYKDKNIRIRTPLGYKLTATVYLGLQNGATTPTPTPPQASTSATPQITPTGAKTRVTILQTPNGFLRVRQQPSLTASEVTRVNTGDTFDLLEETDGWFRIQLVNGTSGWISAQFAEKE